MPVHLPPNSVSKDSHPSVKLIHLIHRIRQQLPAYIEVGVYSERHKADDGTVSYDRGVYSHHVVNDLEYVPELRMDDLRVVDDVDALSEELVKDILAAFEHGEEEHLTNG